MSLRVAPPSPADHAAIRAVVTAAFGQADEADLVEALRQGGDGLVEMAAWESERLVGHILFSRLPLVGPADTLEAAALAPVSVLPDRQGQGVGGRLIVEGIEACRRLGLAAVVVLGHADYYPRFGFSAPAARRLSAPFSGPSFMAMALCPGALDEPRTARYAPAFGLGQ